MGGMGLGGSVGDDDNSTIVTADNSMGTGGTNFVAMNPIAEAEQGVEVPVENEPIIPPSNYHV